jgi:hypothetical protein
VCAGLHCKRCVDPAAPASAECPTKAFAGKFVPWVRAVNQSNMFGVKEGQHNRGLPYLGNFDTEAGCQHACEALSNCTQYDWCGVTGGSVWNGKCFGRCDSVWRLSFVPGLSPAGTEGGNAGVGWPVSARRVEPDKR